ncbi:CRAL/TRIO, N-terminal domain [Dillenia turbinata]|uniref:CRAL/TRIO, N-terminal domain n=1 Tax=Dillenia turbinata TaxID=194707 RepID=A0AAN8ZBR3_9MAGN
MTVEVKAEETQMAEIAVSEKEEAVKAFVAAKVEEEAEKVITTAADRDTETYSTDEPKKVEKSSSFKEESNFISDLKENERKALSDLKAKLEQAILSINLFPKQEKKEEEKKEAKTEEESDKAIENEAEKTEETQKKCESEEKIVNAELGSEENVDNEISIWGVPLLPGKCAEATDVVLLKFLRAREFKVDEAFEMLKNTLQWRKEHRIDSVTEEEFGVEFQSAGYLNGLDREGHPVCYNIFGVFDNEETYQKTFGTKEKREHFLRWRFQLMEKGIQKLDFKPGGVSSLLQINDLQNAPGASKKELRLATKQAVSLLQDNYPEFVAKNIFINVPFWYYAINAREKDFEFSQEDDGVSELIVKGGSTEIIEIPAPEVGSALVWDLSVLGWEVNYKEEFVPFDEGSYTIIVRKAKKMSLNTEPIRNTFKPREPGKVVLTIENMSSKKKRVLYRHKSNKCSSF